MSFSTLLRIPCLMLLLVVLFSFVSSSTSTMTTTCGAMVGNEPSPRRPPPPRRQAKQSSRYFTHFGQLPPLEVVDSTPRRRFLSDGRNNSQTTTTDLILPYSKSDCGKVPVTYTNNPKQVYSWLSDNLPYTGCTIGFDVEFVPNLPWKKKRVSFQGPATVQLATPDSCLVVHLVRPSGRRSEACSPILKAVLCDEMFVKAGCALDDDLLALSELWGGLDARSRLDLGGIGGGDNTEHRRRNPRRGLKALSRVILGVDLPKPKTQVLSDWSQVPLTENQIIYSARDAWAGAAIVNRLAERDPATFDNQNLIRLLESYESSTSNLMERKKRRQRAKEELGKLLEPYKTTVVSSSHKKPSRRHARNLPQPVVEKVRNLRNVIKTVKTDPMLIEVDHLGFEFDEKSHSNKP